jgi:endonuclease VIII
MPEGDTVWATARRLHEALAGRSLTRSDFRVPRFATSDLTGRSVHEVVSRGKHLLARVDGALTVHTHLKMDGAWRIRPAAEPMRDDHRIRLVLANDEWRAVGYRLGVVELIRTANEDRVVGHLGPDLLGPDWDLGEAVRRLRADAARPIGEALMDQTRLAGIGNVYKAEVLFLRGLNPWTPVAAVTDLETLVERAQTLLDTNKARVARTTTGVLRAGEDTWVHGRAGRPCRRCGTRIQKGSQGPATEERITFWCPHCQPQPRQSL